MNTEYNTPETEKYLFADEDLMNYQEASVGQRFVNFVIDSLVMRFGLTYLIGMLIGMILQAISPDTAYDVIRSLQSGTMTLLFFSYLIGCVNYLIYYTFCEKLLKGRTLGKLVTGTRAIRTDGGELTFGDAFLRSLSRIVPFEQFSAFGGSPWHDTWTKTMVIKTR